MDELIKAMDIGELEKLKETYKDNAGIVAILDGYIASKVKEAEQVQAKAEFEKGIAKLFAKLPHPEDIHNVYARWASVNVLDGEPEVIRIGGEVTKEELEEIASFKDNPSMSNEDVKTYFEEKGLKLAQPSHEKLQWVVETNKGFAVKTASGNGQATSKRAITVFKRNGSQLEDKGHYASASKACEALGLTIGGDSATRVLARDGFITEPYEGTEPTS